MPDLTAFIPRMVNGDRWTFRIEGYERGPWSNRLACAVYERELTGTATWEVVGVDLDQGSSRRTYHMQETIVAEMVQDSARGVGYGNSGPCGSSTIPFSHIDTLTITQEVPGVLEFGVPFGHGAKYAPKQALHNQFAGDSLRTTMFLVGSGYAFPWLTLVKNRGLVAARYELSHDNHIRRWTLEPLEVGSGTRYIREGSALPHSASVAYWRTAARMFSGGPWSFEQGRWQQSLLWQVCGNEQLASARFECLGL